MEISDIILVIAATFTALMAGLFYAWSCSVMLGFARLSDREFVSAMQKTNRAIQNPVFFAAFFGAPIFLLISTIVFYAQSLRFWFLLAASLVYIFGTFGVTVAGNVPLNNRIESFSLETAVDAEIAKQRLDFERPWNRLNTIRTISATLALVLVLIQFVIK